MRASRGISRRCRGEAIDGSPRRSRSSQSRWFTTVPRGLKSSGADSGYFLPRHANVAVLEPADHREIEQVTLQREDDIFFRAVMMLAAEARGDLGILRALPDSLQMIVGPAKAGP